MQSPHAGALILHHPSKCARLQGLRLGLNGIGDAGLQALCEMLKTNTSLQSIE